MTATARKRVLIVDDDEDVRRSLKHVLGEEFAVILAADGLKGYEAAASQRVDLVILDVKMPKLDGRTVSAMLRQDPRTENVPILMLSVMASKDDVLEGKLCGADDYMGKPFDAEDLLSRVRRLTASPRPLKKG